MTPLRKWPAGDSEGSGFPEQLQKKSAHCRPGVSPID
jgi:hypothetical protein